MDYPRTQTLHWTYLSVTLLYAVIMAAAGSLSASNLQDAELWCESCVVSCLLMGPSFASCDKGAFFTSIYQGRLGFEVWMHSLSSHNALNGSTVVDKAEQEVPTAYIDAGPAFTNAANLTVRIVFDTPCLGEGFQCQSPSTCDLLVTGDGVVLPSTLQSGRGGLVFSLTVALEAQSQTGKVTLALARGICANTFRNSGNNSSSAVVTIRFDRRPVMVNLWSAVPDTLVQVNNVSRTVQATNKGSDLTVYMDFTHPVRNSSKELLNVLKTNYGIVNAIRRKSHGNRRFGFTLANVPSPAVVIVSLDTSHILSRAGTVVILPSSVTFLYDMARPEVKLTPASRVKTQDRLVPVVVEFTKPVFSFNSQSATVTNGRILRFDEVSKSLYVVHVYADEGRAITLSVLENKTADITGNLNAPSNTIHVRHYVTPLVSIGLYSFTSASFLATSFAAALFSLSSASLAAVGVLTPMAMKSIASDPSKNLLGMAGHLQVFALSSRMAVSLPLEYSETTRGLQWLIPHVKLPWKHGRRFLTIHWNKKTPYQLYALSQLNVQAAATVRGRRLGANASVYGAPFSPSEYELYFSVRKLDSSFANTTLFADHSNGWHDFASNMFWLGASVGVLIFLHIFALAILKWRFRSAARGALILPRFELFLSLYALPGFCQALAFIIRGGTTTGIIVGVILLALPAGFLMSVILFLGVALFLGRFVQYNEVRFLVDQDSPYKRALPCICGYKSIGSWTSKRGLPATFLARFGLIFEDRKGPPHVVTVDNMSSKSLPKWVGSGSNGIGRMRSLDSNGESDDMVISKDGRVVGVAQASYAVVDMARRALLGIVFGAYSPADFSWSQVSILFGSTVCQLLYLVAFRPYISKGLQVVEMLSLLSEAILFALGLALLAFASPIEDNQAVGRVMLALLLLILVVQLGNEWHALMKQLLRLSTSQASSFKQGLRMLLWGLILPLLPEKSLSKFMSNLRGQPNTGLVTVVPVTQEEMMSPDPYDGKEQYWSEWDVRRATQGNRSRGTATSSELKTLRELAKASFPQESNGGGRSFEPQSSLASPSLLIVEHRTPSISRPALHPAGISSEGSSSADLDNVER
ncbi:hypothetical protein GOP47_0024046 [Adiantum capillus-veneris]|uniref:Bacterial Ig-like domain-containing protein n=1 Tax=Adiantum capillus-veneris TaxID=13818 RepID=A0A9D4Z6I5_ADICA|nr:hypothetical protein GOP47_0024046 [Adiantum capillus-veneris]